MGATKTTKTIIKYWTIYKKLIPIKEYDFNVVEEISKKIFFYKRTHSEFYKQMFSFALLKMAFI